MRRTTRRCVLVVCVLSFIVPASASAKDVPHGCVTETTSKTLLACWKHNFWHADATVKWYGQHARRTIYSSNSATARASRFEVRQHTRLRNLARHRIAHFRALLHHTSLPWAFWNCVASGWTGGSPGVGRRVSSGEGGATSYNPVGPYYGRYQADATFIATHGKEQIAKYGNSDPRTWSVLDQTIMAEKGYQSQGPGAWGNTAPPCVYLR